MQMNKSLLVLLCALAITATAFTGYEQPTIKFGLLKYSGGGDWYNDVIKVPSIWNAAPLVSQYKAFVFGMKAFHT